MSITDQNRETIITENNTAQNRLIDILENYSRESSHLTIQEQLHGDVDFSPLREMGFGLVDTITIGKGEITKIVNIPKGIVSFTCIENLIKNIDNLPSSLTHINVSGNLLENIVVSGLNNLKTLNISHNKLTQLENLPTHLEELLCDFNNLSQFFVVYHIRWVFVCNNNIRLRQQ